MRHTLLDNYARGMADYQIQRNPLSQEAIVILNDNIRDHYQDTVITEVARIKKRVLVKKNVDMNYVQEIGYELLEDTDSLPWVVSLTLSGLPRIPRMDDQILIEGLKYTVSQVRPVNRTVDSIVLLFIYPERTVQQDNLNVYQVTKDEDDVYSIIYGGNPVQMAFDKEAIKDESKRRKFYSYFKGEWEKLILFDPLNNYVVFNR